MITAVSTAKKLDWQGWLLGVIRSFIGGGAGSIASSFGAMTIDPEHFNIGSGGLHDVLSLMGVTFLITGIVHMAMFLQTHSVPEPWNGQDRRTPTATGLDQAILR
jgi:hypothetical protein